MVIKLVGFEKLSLDGFVMENYCWLLFVGTEKGFHYSFFLFIYRCICALYVGFSAAECVDYIISSVGFTNINCFSFIFS